MTRLACMHAGLLLEQRAAGLTAAQALRLEEHLAGCERCSADASLLGGLRALSHESDVALTLAARERLIAAALAPARVEHGARRRVSGLQVLALGGALAAAVALGLWAQSARPNAARPTLAAKPAKSGAGAGAPVAAASPVSGPEDEEPDPDGEHVAASSAPQPEDGVLHAPEGATVILAHAEVELRPGTEARWDRGQRTLWLSRGSVLADVDPSAHERFTVKTPGFEVVVLGTRFEVTLE
ncbi:MAG: FecR domain-containing protein, partial [Polyangiales bacterium]